VSRVARRLLGWMLGVRPGLRRMLDWLDRLEASGTPVQATARKRSVTVPQWVLIVVAWCTLAVVYFVTQPPVETPSPHVHLSMKGAAFAVFLWVSWAAIRPVVVRLRTDVPGDTHRRSVVLFWSLALLALAAVLLVRYSGMRVGDADLAGNVYVLPLAGFALLAVLLMSNAWAILFGMMVAVLATGVYGWSFEHFTYFLISVLGVVPWGSRIYTRRDLMPVVLRSAAFNTVVGAATLVLVDRSAAFGAEPLGDFAMNVLLRQVAFGCVVGGVFNWVVVMVFLTPFENLFQRTTAIKLVELADFNHPLLTRLVAEAPGTYHHSLIVASLAERAAAEIGGRGLLCKVAGYYHDVGKLIRPEYFIENQIATTNPHDDLNPSLSAQVIINHVRDGVALAEQHGLDRPIVDIIRQHHGNSLIHGLYGKSLEPGTPAVVDNIRYPGPRPQTREAAVVMIADSCEAACRAAGEPDVARIKETVERVINAKFTDGQFDDTRLTLRDLYRISGILTQMLASVYHVRAAAAAAADRT